MIDIIIFIFAFYFCLFSVLGYGSITRILIFKNYKNNIDFSVYIGFYGLLLITLISFITSLFIPHNYFHNIILNIVGLIFFIFIPINKKFFYLKYIIIISFIIFSLLLISKTHDDFSYYHLPFTKYLTENKIIFGLGHLNHGYNLLSSLFFLNSAFYLPLIEIYSFHFSSLFFLIFFNYFLLYEIFKKKNDQVIKYLYILSFAFFNVSFNRLAEFGTDKTGQLLMIILVIKLFEIVCFRKDNSKVDEIILLLPLLGYCITLKTYFLPYILLSLILFFINKNYLENIKLILFSKAFVLFSALLAFNFIHHFVSTGCFISPIHFTCFDNLNWTRDIAQIKGLSIWLEQWSKAGAGPNFRVENLDVYIQNLNWVGNWFERYFIVKFVDQIAILIVIFIILILILNKFSFKRSKFNFNLNILLFYSLLSVVFLIWFFKHPALRYGGYSIFFLMISIPFSLFVSRLKESLFFNRNLKFFIIFVFIIINIKNFTRIHDEYNRDDMYKFTSFPYFYIHKTNFKKLYFDNNLTMFSSVGHCWSTPTPCGHIEDLNISKKNGYYFLSRSK